MNGDSTLLGFNTNDDIKKPYTDAGLDISDPNTDAIQLGDIPIVYKDLDGNGTPEVMVLVTNRLDLDADLVALAYRNSVRLNFCMAAELSDATVRDARSTPSHWPIR